MPISLCSLFALLAILLLLIPAGAEAATLRPRDGGGWETVGLPYTARISAAGNLESLVVGDFDFLAPSGNAAHGLFMVDTERPVPFTSARVAGDVLELEGPGAKVSLAFRSDRIEGTVQNASVADGHFLRLELNKAVTRIKNPLTGIEYELPIKGNISEKMRLIAPNGTELTLPGAYLYLQGAGYYVKLPYFMPGAGEYTFSLDISPAIRVEDRVKVVAKAAAEDYVYWGNDPQPFTTEVMNMDGAAFRGAISLRLIPYLTKTVAREIRQPLTLPRGGSKTLTWTLEKLDPSLYLVEIWVERDKERGLNSTPRIVYHASAVKMPDAPRDFDEFWQRTLEEQAKIPLDLQMTKVSEKDKSETYKFSFAGMLGHRCYGYLTVPKDKTKKVPAVLILPSSGVHTLQQPSFPQGDYAAMAINIAWVDVDLPAEQYDWRTWPAPYLVTGILDPDYYSLRFSYAAIVRAAELLAARPEVQPDNILVTGSSQGGGLTLVAAGLYPKFKAAVANVPGLCRLDWNLDFLQPPYFPIAVSSETKPMVQRTLKYYDAAQFAHRITCPTWVSLGLFDDVTPSMGVFCAYNAIPGQKKLLVQPFTGHGGGWPYMEAVKGVWP